MSLFACNPIPPMSLFVTNFGHLPPTYSGDVIFEWPLNNGSMQSFVTFDQER